MTLEQIVRAALNPPPLVPPLAVRVMLLAIAQEAGFSPTMPLDELLHGTVALGLGVEVWEVDATAAGTSHFLAVGRNYGGGGILSRPLVGRTQEEAWCLTVADALVATPWCGAFAPEHPTAYDLARRAARWRGWLAQQHWSLDRP